MVENLNMAIKEDMKKGRAALCGDEIDVDKMIIETQLGTKNDVAALCGDTINLN